MSLLPPCKEMFLVCFQTKTKAAASLQTKKSAPHQHCSYIFLPATRKGCGDHQSGSSCIPLQQRRRKLELLPRCHLQLCHRYLWERARKSLDWFNSVADMEPAIEAKRTALPQYKKSPSGKTLLALRQARSNCQ